MKKLSNGIEFDNSYFQPAFGEYLISNGFKTSYQGHVLTFYTAALSIRILNNNIDVFEWKHDADKTKEQWVFVRSMFGYAHMDLFMWMMLMHVMNVVKLNDFMKRAASSNPQERLEAKKLVEWMVHTHILEMAHQ